MKGFEVRGSTPEMTLTEGGRPAPTSAMPNPSPSFAIAHCVDAMTRSATFVVATEQLVGCDGMPTTQCSRSLTSTRLKAPAFRGIS